MRIWTTIPAAIAALCLVGAPGAAAAASAKSAALLQLQPGDQVVIVGSKLRCLVSTAAPSTMVCAVIIPSQSNNPKPSTYAIAVAEGASALLRSDATGNPKLVRREPEPVVKGDVFPLPARPSATTLHAGGGTTLMLVGGTHVLCAVTQQRGGPAVTCGVGTGKGASIYKTPGYVAVVSDSTAILSKETSLSKIATVVVKSQPAGA